MTTRQSGVRIQEILGEVASSTRGTLRGTAEVYVKPYEASNHVELANEFICGRLANMIGLACPAGDIAQLPDGTRCFVDLGISTADGETPAPPDMGEIVAVWPNFAAAVLVFDTWILNLDRHEENLLYAPGITPYVIDHGDALLRSPAAIAAPERTIVRVAERHVFRDQVLHGQEREIVRRIAGLPSTAIRDPLTRARVLGLITRDDELQLHHFLMAYRARLPDILEQARGGRVDQPRLFGEEGETT